MKYNLAQVNIGRIVGPMDSPVMAEFKANLDPINKLAEESPGFVWRLKDETNNATSIKVFDDELMIVNLSIWKDAASLFEFVYKSGHVDYFKRRKEWFERMTELYLAMWFVPEGEFPTAQQAIHRLDYLRRNGESPYAFTFRSKYTAADAEAYAPVV